MLDAVIDVSHHNQVASFEALRGAGVLGVIHKATQGAGYVDPTFAANRRRAQEAGLLFGAYHFGTGGRIAAQIEHFLTVAAEVPLLVLDLEENPQGEDMNLHEAEQFVHEVHAHTGRYPGLYSGHTIKEMIAAAGIRDPAETELSRCWLWIAQYGPEAKIPSIWPAWTLWQYTDGEINSDGEPLPGIGRCDRERYNGTTEELLAFWRVTGLVRKDASAGA